MGLLEGETNLTVCWTIMIQFVTYITDGHTKLRKHMPLLHTESHTKKWQILCNMHSKIMTVSAVKQIKCHEPEARFWLTRSHSTSKFHASIILVEGGLFTERHISTTPACRNGTAFRRCTANTRLVAVSTTIPGRGVLSVHRQTEQTHVRQTIYKYCQAAYLSRTSCSVSAPSEFVASLPAKYNNIVKNMPHRKWQKCHYVFTRSAATVA